MQDRIHLAIETNANVEGATSPIVHHPEETHQAIQRDTDRDKVDDGDVHHAEMPVVCRFTVQSMVLQNDSRKSAQWLDSDILKDAIFHELQEVLVKWVVVKAIKRGKQLSALGSCNLGPLHFVVIAEIRE